MYKYKSRIRLLFYYMLSPKKNIKKYDKSVNIMYMHENGGLNHEYIIAYTLRN